MTIDPRTLYDYKSNDWAGFNCRYNGKIEEFPAKIEKIENGENGLPSVVEIANPIQGFPKRIPVGIIEWIRPVEAR